MSEEHNRNRWVQVHPDFMKLAPAYAERIQIHMEIGNFAGAKRIIDQAEAKLAEIRANKPVTHEEFLRLYLAHEQFQIPTRVVNTLRTMGIETVSDLLHTEMAKLKMISGIDIGSIRVILEGLLRVNSDRHLDTKIKDRLRDFPVLKSKAKKVEQ